MTQFTPTGFCIYPPCGKELKDPNKLLYCCVEHGNMHRYELRRTTKAEKKARTPRAQEWVNPLKDLSMRERINAIAEKAKRDGTYYGT